jgi:hypothetical protein
LLGRRDERRKKNGRLRESKQEMRGIRSVKRRGRSERLDTRRRGSAKETGNGIDVIETATATATESKSVIVIVIEIETSEKAPNDEALGLN